MISRVSHLAIGAILILVGQGVWRQCRADVLFEGPTYYPTRQTPVSLAAGDVNGDGTVDLAAACTSTSVVSVLLGNGDGTFQPKADFGAGSHSNGVAIGDLNLDGYPDLAVAQRCCQAGNNLVILLGRGNGTFGDPDFFAGGWWAYSVAIGDINLDGKPDVAVANYSDPGKISVVMGNGDGTFVPPISLDVVGSYPLFVTIGDLNGDAWPDLVATGGTNSISVFLGAGGGAFYSRADYETGFDSHPSSVAIGDINVDGLPDLVVTNSSAWTVSVLLGTGNGSFGTRIDSASGRNPSSVAIGEIDGDGRPDLAVANGGSNTVSVLIGQGDGTFQPKIDFSSGGSTPASLVLQDLNQDGWLDIAVSNCLSDNVAVLLRSPGVVDAPDAGSVTDFRVLPVMPNPAAGDAVIRLELPWAGHVGVEVWDTSGRRVRELDSGQLAMGPHAVVWDGRDDRGRAVLSGIYFVRACWEGRLVEARMVRLR